MRYFWIFFNLIKKLLLLVEYVIIKVVLTTVISLYLFAGTLILVIIGYHAYGSIKENNKIYNGQNTN